MPGANPAAFTARLRRECGVVVGKIVDTLAFHLEPVFERGQHDLWSERERRGHRGRRYSSVVGAVGCATLFISVEATPHAIYLHDRGAGALACAGAPATFRVAR